MNPLRDSLADSLTQRLRQLKAGSLLPHLAFLHSGSLPCRRQQRTLAIAIVIQNPRRTLAARILCGFTSRVWITYRSHFYPIEDSSLTVLEREQAEAAAAGVPIPISSSPPSKRWWSGDEKGWTSEAGWVCMLQMGQSLLATALIHLHLGRGT